MNCMKTKQNQRLAGVLMPVASLPGTQGAGTLGSNARRFVDFLARTGFHIWQVLPLNPLGYGNSPYQPLSSYAGDPLYIDLEQLVEEGYLPKLPAVLPLTDRIDYEAARAFRDPLLRQAFSAFEAKGLEQGAFEAFCSAQSWVYPYAVFAALKEQNGGKCWNQWPQEQRDWIVNRRYDIGGLETDIRFRMFLQYEFAKQWKALKEYANGKGVYVAGDIPFYVGLDSLDVWQGRDSFLLDQRGNPDFVAGVPPDYFSPTGQRWGNPIYDWEQLQKDGFRFWLDRISYSATLYDIIRIDHFRAFDTFWKIPASCPTAVEGEWIEPPGYELLDTLFQRMPNLWLIAEDLGDLRPEVLQLRDAFHLPGMNVAQFTLNRRGSVTRNQVSYTGTHDNQTVLGWYRSLKEGDRWWATHQLKKTGRRQADVVERMIQMVLDCASDYAVIPAMDLLGLDDSGRLNTPGTVGSPNWEWRLTELEELERRRGRLRCLIRHAGRL